ncbi:hypothetical protein MUP77_08115, partial [Candidatus Bathyarchaeota archaeon]|nr:hypothetical protein [Candidatus Bathyarchaeota archaeon]
MSPRDMLTPLLAFLIGLFGVEFSVIVQLMVRLNGGEEDRFSRNYIYRSMIDTTTLCLSYTIVGLAILVVYF